MQHRSAQPLSDEDLMERFQAGNGDAFRVLVERYRDRLLRFVFSVYQRDLAAAEDWTQEVFLRITRYRELMLQAFNVAWSTEGELRLSSAVSAELEDAAPAQPRPVMTLDEVAAYLRVSPATIEELLPEIPCFELGGQLLFRRDSIDAWTRNRERKLRYEMLEFDVKQELTL